MVGPCGSGVGYGVGGPAPNHPGTRQACAVADIIRARTSPRDNSLIPKGAAVSNAVLTKLFRGAEGIPQEGV